MNSPIYHRINKQIRKTNKMTYALGVECADGVILATDTKFTVNGGSDYVYGHKITGEISGVLTAFAGSREPFEEFRIRLREYASEPECIQAKVKIVYLISSYYTAISSFIS